MNKTPLNQWHHDHGAKMVDFEGWEMPLQYASGIIGEHMATRRHCGLFDVSHMGRYRVVGDAAVAFLMACLTNNAEALQPGEAQYTFIPNDDGGAIDDAYLYCIDDDDFILVVNAGNRERDWAWLNDRLPAQGVSLSDESGSLCMFSLQGPRSSEVLTSIVPPAALPENKRNRLSQHSLAGASITIARTGYTGEPVCFELFVPSEQAQTLWQQLCDAGASPVGLGARDSLRLEAGLPLYGHELGPDIAGNDIPIFANGLASFAVRTVKLEGLAWAEPLERQRRELDAIRRHEMDRPVAERCLPRLVKPVAVFDGRRPIRAGYPVFLGDQEVGYVTSGTSVPSAEFSNNTIDAEPVADHALRPIGLALIDSDLYYRDDEKVLLRIVDPRGNEQTAELVERNLWPVARHARAYKGFEAPGQREKPHTREAVGNYGDLADELREAARHNTRWRRESCINLIPSEQVTSSFVDALCREDPSGRYNEHNHMKGLGAASEDVRYYKGTQFIMARELELQRMLGEFFQCSRVETRVISGQMANDTVYDALKQFRSRYRRGRDPRLLGPVLVHDLNKGGHLSAQVPGALKNYVRINPATERADVLHFPFQPEQPHKIDVARTIALIEEHAPDLIVFGRSVIIHREPVAEISAFVHRHFGADNPNRPIILYDGAHVLGLLGPHFQSPLAEGADFVTGSTHKTFFGPQRGVILSNIEIGSVFELLWQSIGARAFPGHVSNHHLGTLLGLLGATYEMLAFKDAYQSQVISNAKHFAAALASAGLQLEGDRALEFTETHQVLVRGRPASGERMASCLEANHIITTLRHARGGLRPARGSHRIDSRR
jgi:aminomethyltransferase